MKGKWTKPRVFGDRPSEKSLALCTIHETYILSLLPFRMEEMVFLGGGQRGLSLTSVWLKLV